MTFVREDHHRGSIHRAAATCRRCGYEMCLRFVDGDFECSNQERCGHRRETWFDTLSEIVLATPEEDHGEGPTKWRPTSLRGPLRRPVDQPLARELNHPEC